MAAGYASANDLANRIKVAQVRAKQMGAAPGAPPDPVRADLAAGMSAQMAPPPQVGGMAQPLPQPRMAYTLGGNRVATGQGAASTDGYTPLRNPAVDLMTAGTSTAQTPSVMKAGTPTPQTNEAMGPPNPAQQMTDRRNAIAVRDAELVQKMKREQVIHGNNTQDFGDLREQRFTLGDERSALEGAMRPVVQPQGPAQIASNRSDLHDQLMAIGDSKLKAAMSETDPAKRAALIGEGQRIQQQARTNLPAYGGGAEDPEVSRIHDAQAAAVPAQESNRNAYGERAATLGGMNIARERFGVEALQNRAAVARANMARDLATAKYEGSPETIEAQGKVKQIQAQQQLAAAQTSGAAGSSPAQREAGVSRVFGSPDGIRSFTQDAAGTIDSLGSSLTNLKDQDVLNFSNKMQVDVMPKLRLYAQVDPAGAAEVARQLASRFPQSISLNPLRVLSPFNPNRSTIQARWAQHLVPVEEELRKMAGAGQ